MDALAVAAQPGRAGLQPDQTSYPGVQPVGGDQVAGRLAVDQQVVAPVDQVGHRRPGDLHPGRRDGLAQRRVQGGPPHAQPGPAAERGLGLVRCRRGSGSRRAAARPGRTPSTASARDRPGISPSPQALSIGPSAARDHHVQPRAGGVQGGGQPDRSAAGDQQVTRASAGSGPGPRPPPGAARTSRAALSTVKPSAVHPDGVHQRQRHPLDDHGDVVGVAEHPVGARAHRRQPGYDDHPGVPATAQGGDAPPAQGLGGQHQRQHRPGQSAGTTGRSATQRLDRARRPAARCAAAPSPGSGPGRSRPRHAPGSTRCCAGRPPARRAARGRPGRRRRRRRSARSCRADQRSRTSSEQNPGPMASSRP